MASPEFDTVTLLTADGAGDPSEGAGTAICSSQTWGEAAWTAHDLYDGALPSLRRLAVVEVTKHSTSAEPVSNTPKSKPAVELEHAGAPAALAAAAAVSHGRTRRGNGRLKIVLTVLMLLGALASFMPGTFASFAAETTNTASTIASGTLTMSNQINSQTACLSNASASNDNVANCDALVTLQNVAPGVSTAPATALVTVKNTGSLDASKLWLWAPSVTPTLTTALTSGSPVGSLAVTQLKGGVTAGQAVIVRNGASSQTFYASAGAAVNATAINVVSQTANASYPIATSTVQVADCYDTKTTATPPGAPNAKVGTDLNFNPTTGNPMCGALLLYVQEVTGMVAGTPSTQNYCWAGLKYSSGGPGMCVAPIAVTLTAAATGSPAALTVSQLNGNIRANDLITVTPSSGTPQTFTAGADVYAGATSITLTGATVTGTLAIGSTVTDSATDASGPLAKLNADAVSNDTLANFDTLHDFGRGPIQMPPVLSNGALGATALTQLTHDASRKFLVGLYLPNPTGSNQNPLQGLSSKFGLTWHIDQ